MTAAGSRWCEQHQRPECTALRRYRSAHCHNKPLRGTARCHAHTFRVPAASPRALAHQRVSIAIADGILIPPAACEMCARTRDDGAPWGIYAHHEDYARPLDVIWLCGSCHSRIHGHHGGLPAYLAWLRAQLADAERLHERFYGQLAEAAAVPA